jgi:type I restriction enzyme, S subunit
VRSDMTSDRQGWRRVALGGACRKIGSGATPRGGEDAYTPTGVALIRSKNVLDLSFSFHGLARIPDEAADVLRGVSVEAGDVLLNITGQSVARCCRAPQAVLPARVNQHVAIVRPDPEELDSRFLQYALVVNKPRLLALASAGATREALTKAMISEFEIEAPGINEQRRISAVLGSLEEKIENNRRLVKTIEEIATALFKVRFIDFVGQEELVDSAIGRIPKGWQVAPLKEVLAEIEVGVRPRGGVSKYKGGVPSIGAESIVGLGQFDYSKTKFIPPEFFASMKRGRVASRDVLLYKDGGRPGEFEPHITLFGDGFPFDEFAINEHVYRLRARADLGQTWLYFSLSSDRTMEEMRIKGTGVAIPGLNSTQVRSLTTLVPPTPEIETFNGVVEPLLGKLLALCRQNTQISELRDALLPRLISGQIRIPLDAKPAAEVA